MLKINNTLGNIHTIPEIFTSVGRIFAAENGSNYKTLIEVAENHFNYNLDQAEKNICGAIVFRNDINAFLSNYKPSNWSKKEAYVVCLFNNPMIDFVILVKDINDKISVLHEVSHAFYKYDHYYREKVSDVWNKLNSQLKSYVINLLTAHGYKDKEIIDEFAAYLIVDQLKGEYGTAKSMLREYILKHSGNFFIDLWKISLTKN